MFKWAFISFSVLSLISTSLFAQNRYDRAYILNNQPREKHTPPSLQIPAPINDSDLSFNQESNPARINAKLGALEEEIRNLTGRVETLEYENRELTKKISNIQKSYNTAPRRRPTKNGSVNKDTAPLKQITNREQFDYDQAFAWLRQSRYEEAEKAFSQFIEHYPNHELVSNAYYWLGETHYVRQNYKSSAIEFLKGYKKYPKGNKAADSLLKLSISLGHLKKTEEACASLEKLISEFPTAPNAIKQRAENEAQKHDCSSL